MCRGFYPQKRRRTIADPASGREYCPRRGASDSALRVAWLAIRPRLTRNRGEIIGRACQNTATQRPKALGIAPGAARLLAEPPLAHPYYTTDCVVCVANVGHSRDSPDIAAPGAPIDSPAASPVLQALCKEIGRQIAGQTP